MWSGAKRTEDSCQGDKSEEGYFWFIILVNNEKIHVHPYLAILELFCRGTPIPESIWNLDYYWTGRLTAEISCTTPEYHAEVQRRNTTSEHNAKKILRI